MKTKENNIMIFDICNQYDKSWAPFFTRAETSFPFSLLEQSALFCAMIAHTRPFQKRRYGFAAYPIGVKIQYQKRGQKFTKFHSKFSQTNNPFKT